MSKKRQEDNRDVFDKALDDQDRFYRSPTQKAYRKKISEETVEGGLRTIGGAALGLGGYVLGRKIARKIKPKLDEGFRIMPPLVSGAAGAYAGMKSGNYPAIEATKKRRRK